MVDINSVIALIVVLAVVYVLVKFIVSPAIKIITGIVILLLIIYILQNFFDFNFEQLGPYGKYLDVRLWVNNFGSQIGSLVNYIQQFFSFSKTLLDNVPKQ